MTHTELSRFFSSAANLPAPLQQTRNRMFQGGDFRQAAVLLAVVQHEAQWQILLTRRADSLRHHTGQIALAGGRRDAQDPNLTATALREAAEETGIEAAHWQTFPQLPAYFTPSGYAVAPVPALSAESPLTRPNADEVAEIFYLPLDFALYTANYQSRAFTHNGLTLSTPTLPYRHYDIWGLTAMILHDLAERYRLFHTHPKKSP